MQDVTAPPTFNPHGGPITHSSTGSKPDSPAPLFLKLILTLGFVWKITSHLPSDLFWYQTQYLFPLLWTLSHLVTGIKRLPGCLKLLMIPSYFALDIFLSFNSRATFRHFPRCCLPDSQPCRGLFLRDTPLFFRKYAGVPKEGSWLHDDLKKRNEDINVKDLLLRGEQPKPRRSVRIS